MDELVGWLCEQLDEDERIARAAGHERVAPTPWHGESWDDAVLDGDGLVDANGNGIAVVKGELVRAHIAEWDPARVLREIEAKRQLLDEHQDVNDGWCGTCVDGRWGYPTHGGSSPQRYPCRTLRLLALPYADRPGYRDEWRP
ncbi:DUF6221 family protein [Streptomyces sp. NPDC001139]